MRKLSIVEYIMLGLFALSFGLTTFFLVSANSELRSEKKVLTSHNKLLENKNKVLLLENDSLHSRLAERDSFIIQKSVELDSLKSDLQRINNKGIVTNYESYSIVRSLDLRGQIDILTRYISASDSIGN